MSDSKDAHQKSLEYRPDIDGLRAIAVLAVLLYHARLGITGGFVGVDVFFVLSGFLITSIILKDAGGPAGFSIVKFWERRIRRILPALVVVIAATVVAGWLILLPSDFEGLGKSVLAQAVFAGNFYYWLSGGYFAQPAIFKPLLHTWSLAVEEQYYLFFPILFLPWWKLKMTTLRWIILLGALVSLALSVVMTKSSPDAAFYLLPSRAWELFGGALLAMTRGNLKVAPVVAEIVGFAGILAIGLAFWRFNDKTSFPGIAAVLPCAGAAALVWANGLDGQTTAMARLLSLRPLVFVGRISYSLYLWHWPVLVYAMYWQEYGLLRWYTRIALLGGSFVMAVLSWKFVETPFRTRRLLPHRRALFAFGLGAPLACALIGVFVLHNHGVPSRFSEAVIRCDAVRPRDANPFDARSAVLQLAHQGEFPRYGNADGPVYCLVWGDSHAGAIAPALAQAATNFSSTVEVASFRGTPPILDFESGNTLGLGKDSERWNQSVVDHVARDHVSNVVLVARWSLCWALPSSVQGPDLMQQIAAKVAATTVALQKAGARVWIMKDVPYQSIDVPKALAKTILRGTSSDIGVTMADHMSLSRQEDEIFSQAAADGATILDPTPYFFPNRNTCLLMTSGEPLYADHDHVSHRGALMLVDLFSPIWANQALSHHDITAHPSSKN